MLKKAGTIYRRHRRWLAVVFFILGFLFDALVLKEPHDPLTIIHQGVYLLLSGLLLALEVIETQNPIRPPRFLSSLWRFREAALHFLMGTLLNAYMIFFFKSASAITSFFFLAFMVLVLLANELKTFGRFQTQVRVAILSLCLICYFVNLAPLFWGALGPLPFFGGNVAALVPVFFFILATRSSMTNGTPIIRKLVLTPFFCIQILFIALYLTRCLPPVPLTAPYIGIFHRVEKTEAGYLLTYTRPDDFFWEHGDQTFYARPGDSLHCFVRIFAPPGFNDQLQVRWSFHDPKLGWLASDAITIPIIGGRRQGFRGFTKKSNYQPGDWRVHVETVDGREIGRIDFKVVSLDASSEEVLTEKTVLQ